jgi:hypothetical protein
MISDKKCCRLNRGEVDIGEQVAELGLSTLLLTSFCDTTRKLAFIGLCIATPELTQGIQRIIYFDAMSIVLLLVAAIIFWRNPSV